MENPSEEWYNMIIWYMICFSKTVLSDSKNISIPLISSWDHLSISMIIYRESTSLLQEDCGAPDLVDFWIYDLSFWYVLIHMTYPNQIQWLTCWLGGQHCWCGANNKPSGKLTVRPWQSSGLEDWFPFKMGDFRVNKLIYQGVNHPLATGHWGFLWVTLRRGLRCRRDDTDSAAAQWPELGSWRTSSDSAENQHKWKTHLDETGWFKTLAILVQTSN